jgi:hypothetical protein
MWLGNSASGSSANDWRAQAAKVREHGGSVNCTRFVDPTVCKVAKAKVRSVAQPDPVPRAVEAAFLARVTLRAEEFVDGRVQFAASDAWSDHPEGDPPRLFHRPEGSRGFRSSHST